MRVLKSVVVVAMAAVGAFAAALPAPEPAPVAVAEVANHVEIARAGVTTLSASALAAAVCLRSILGATLPLAGPSMYRTMGLGWGNTLLGFVCLVFVPVPILFLKFGRKIREKYPVKL